MAPKRTKMSKKAELEASQSQQEQKPTDAERPRGKGMAGPPPPPKETSEIAQKKQTKQKKVPAEKPLKRKRVAAEKPLKQSKKADMKNKMMKKIRTVKKNPYAPKAPAGGAYGVYIKEHREEIQKDLSKDGAKPSAADIAKEAGSRWKALGEAEKKVYQDQFAAKMEAYKKEVEEFKAKGGKTMVANPKAGLMQGVKMRKSPLAPKMPAGGGFSVFLNENRNELKKGLQNAGMSAVTKKASAAWKALGSPDRRAYKEKFATKSAAYKQELEAFKASGGQVQVVDIKVNKRRKTNNKPQESAEEKRKKEDDAARAAIDRMRAARSTLVGA